VSETDNIAHPPLRPFYDEPRRKPQRKGGFSPYPPTWHDARAREFAEEMKKPVAQRTGKLRSMKAGDFTPDELIAFSKMYSPKGKFRP